MAQTRKDEETLNLLLRDFPKSVAEKFEEIGNRHHRKRNDHILWLLEGIAEGRLEVRQIVANANTLDGVEGNKTAA